MKNKKKNTITMPDLNPNQIKFCQLYMLDKEHRGSQVESYGKAYKIDISNNKKYFNASVCATRLLKNVKIIEYCKQLLEENGLNDVNVDRKLTWLIDQCADLPVSLGGIREYNKMTGRIKDNEPSVVRIEIENYGTKGSTREIAVQVRPEGLPAPSI